MTISEVRYMYLKDLYEKLELCNQTDDFGNIMDYLYPNDLIKFIESGSNRVVNHFGINQNHSTYNAIQTSYNRAYNYANEILPVWNALYDEVGRSNIVSFVTKGILKFLGLPIGGKLIGKLTGFGYLVRLGDGDNLMYHWDKYNASFITGVEYDFDTKIWTALLDEFGK